jgi:hypothetical protein
LVDRRIGLFVGLAGVVFCAVVAVAAARHSRLDLVIRPALTTAPRSLRAAEERGLGLAVTSPIYAELVRVLTADLAEVGRDGFDPSWLRDADARFELVGLVPRLDRAFVEPGSCGELRRIYRLTLERRGRPRTRLPMTLSLLTLPRGDCAMLAQRVMALRDVDAVVALYRGSPDRIEVNLQNRHVPANPQDNEDHAEYLLRSFDVRDGELKVRPLLATPREDLDAGAQDRLAAFIREHFAEADRGTLVIPDEFLATRAISVSPRGLARRRNRPFATLFGGDGDKQFANLPYDRAKIARSPRALLRRLDEGTCQGCHQSRAIAGFHLLGEERDDLVLNRLQTGISDQLSAELPWREAYLDAVADRRAYDVPRPFAEAGRCGLGDPGFAAYTCKPGFACVDDRNDELGACVPAGGPHEGDACERSTPNGEHLNPLPTTPCHVSGRVVLRDACLGNGLGFPGGMCTDACSVGGGISDDIACAAMPMSGYEMACFSGKEALEHCLETHSQLERLHTCDASHPCRDDYACARSTGPRGVCIPPYFVFQLRVDGPRVDR